MRLSRRTTGGMIAGFLALGVIATTMVALRSQVQADTLVPGYATAHIHLEVMVCATPQLPIKATFTPETGKRYYFKERTFELSPGLNTIEWYIRKIPGLKAKAQISTSEGIVTPDGQDVALEADQVSDSLRFSIFICEPTPTPTPIPTPTPTPIPTVTYSTTVTTSPGSPVAPPVPQAPEKPSATSTEPPLSPPVLI